MSHTPSAETHEEAGSLTELPPLRTLLVAGRRKPPADELRRQITEDQIPDSLKFEDAIGAICVDEDMLAAAPGIRGRILRALPFALAQAIEVLRLRREVDAVFCWGEIPTVLTAGLLCFTKQPVCVALLIWPSKPKKAVPLRLISRRIDVWLVPSPLQRDFVRENLRAPPDRMPDVRWPVDTTYWRPMSAEQDTICAVGQEMRDYPTFIEALRPLGIPCHIAVGASVYAQTSEGWYADLRGTMPAGTTVGPKSYPELRQLYARSRFVVAPLIPSDNDSGITAILEAMASGRAVIVTESPGQTGTLIDGINCLRVPPADPAALRKAMRELWDDPERCARLGAAGRKTAETLFDHGLWTEKIVSTIVALPRGGAA